MIPLDTPGNPYKHHEARVAQSWDGEGEARLVTRGLAREWVVCVGGVEIARVPKVQMEKATHEYSLNEVMATSTRVHHVQYANPDLPIISVSKLAEYRDTRAKGKEYYAGRGSRKLSEGSYAEYSRAFKMCVERHLRNLSKESYTQLERHRRYMSYQDGKKVAQLLNGRLMSQLESHVFHKRAQLELVGPEHEVEKFRETCAHWLDLKGYGIEFPVPASNPMELMSDLVYDKASRDGVKLHEYLEYRLRGEEPAVFLETYDEQNYADQFINEFVPVLRECGVEFEALETLVSSYRHQVAGTVDAVLKFADGSRAILDWKRGGAFLEEIMANQSAKKVTYHVGAKFKGPLRVVNDKFPARMRVVITEFTASSCAFDYSHQMGGYRFVLVVNGEDGLSEFVYIGLMHPLLEGKVCIQISEIHLTTSTIRKDPKRAANSWHENLRTPQAYVEEAFQFRELECIAGPH